MVCRRLNGPLLPALAAAFILCVGCAHTRWKPTAVRTIFVAPPTTVGVAPTDLSEPADWACPILRESLETEIRRGGIARSVREWSPDETPPAVLSVILTRCRWTLEDLPRDPAPGDAGFISHHREIKGLYLLWDPATSKILASGRIHMGQFEVGKERPDPEALRLSLASTLHDTARICAIELGLLEPYTN